MKSSNFDQAICLIMRDLDQEVLTFPLMMVSLLEVNLADEQDHFENMHEHLASPKAQEL